MSKKSAVNKLPGGRTATTTVLIFLTPWLISLVVFWYGPIIYTLILGFMRYRLIGNATFVGLKNYMEIINDPFFWKSLSNTFAFGFLFVPVNFVISLTTAQLLALPLPAKGLFRTLIYVPAILPGIAVLVLGKFLFFEHGLVNTVLSVFGKVDILWLTTPALIKPAAVMLLAWQCGTAMIIYLGALKAVPSQYYEAARMDGVTPFGQFVRITLPLISPTIFFRIIVDLIASAMVLTPALVLPDVRGGPASASRFYALHIYEKFQRFNFGETSALATILIIICFILTVIVMRMSRRLVHYEV